MPDSKLSHEDLRKIAIQWLKARTVPYKSGPPRGGRCSIVASELVSAATDTPDAIGWDSYGKSILIECKASRSDFRVDGCKPRSKVGEGMGSQRYYLAERGVIPTNEVPEDWGLLETSRDGKYVECAVRAPSRELPAVEQCNEKLILMSLIRRINKREFLIIQAEEMDEILSSNPEAGDGV